MQTLILILLPLALIAIYKISKHHDVRYSGKK